MLIDLGTSEILAKNSLFLFSTTLTQRFRFLPPTELVDPTLKPSLDPISGLTLLARPCLAQLNNRNLKFDTRIYRRKLFIHIVASFYIKIRSYARSFIGVTYLC